MNNLGRFAAPMSMYEYAVLKTEDKSCMTCRRRVLAVSKCVARDHSFENRLHTMNSGLPNSGRRTNWILCDMVLSASRGSSEITHCQPQARTHHSTIQNLSTPCESHVLQRMSCKVGTWPLGCLRKWSPRRCLRKWSPRRSLRRSAQHMLLRHPHPRLLRATTILMRPASAFHKFPRIGLDLARTSRQFPSVLVS